MGMGAQHLFVASREVAKALASRHRLVLCCLLVGFGCSKYNQVGSKPPPMTLLSGQVLYHGKPLPGGKVIFRTTQDGNTYGSVIDENGGYSTTVPAGEAQVGIDNRILQQRSPNIHQAGRMGAGRRPGGPAPEEVKGSYVSIPSKYYNPVTSGLSLTVGTGSQTYNITLD
jgi:hypothetical protein